MASRSSTRTPKKSLFRFFCELHVKSAFDRTVGVQGNHGPSVRERLNIFGFCDGAIAFSAFMNKEASCCRQVEDNNFKLGNYSTSA